MKRLLLQTSFILLTVFSTVNSCNASNYPDEKKDGTRISVLVIDPGHGGRDSGAAMGSAREKDIVLSISKLLGAQIKKAYPNIKVIYTRTKDEFIPLHKRADIANKNDADLFISVHVNAVGHRGVRGTETFVLGQHRSDDNLEVAKKENAVILLENDYEITYEGFDNTPESYIMFELVQDEYKEQSISLATEIQKQFKVKAKRIDRSVKEAGFLVLRQTTMPGVLVETGFLSNTSERSYLLSKNGQTQLASAIFTAFTNYKNKFEARSSFHMVAEAPQKETAPKVETPKPPVKVEPKLYYSVQIQALGKKLETKPANFKGEKSIFRKDAKNISRYFSGKFKTEKDALREKKRLRKKYPEAFVVAFVNGQLTSVKKVKKSNKR